MILVTHNYSSKILQPRKQPFYFPTAFVTAKFSSVLRFCSFAIGSMRSNQFNLKFCQLFIQTLVSWAFVSNFINTFPKTFDPNNILFTPTVTALFILFAIMGYAAYISVGEAKIFGEKLWLDD
jgi:hypothetical protein